MMDFLFANKQNALYESLKQYPIVDLATVYDKGVRGRTMSGRGSNWLLAKVRDAITRVLDYSHWNKIVLFNKIALDEDGNVEDPHYQTATVYRRVAKHIENGCKRLVEQWKLQPPKPED